MGKIKNMVSGLIGKAENTYTRYEETAERKQAELLETQAALHDAQEKLKDFEKMKILGDITEQTYIEASSEAEALQKKVQTIQREISLLDAYRDEDVLKEIAEVDKVKKDFDSERIKEVARISFELQQAKKEYLEKLITARGEYYKAIKEDNKLQHLLVKLGKKENVYISDAFQGVGFSGISENTFGRTSVMVTQQEAFSALHDGRLPTETRYALEYGKKLGYIK